MSRLVSCKEFTVYTLFINSDDFAWLYIPVEGCSNQVQCRSFRGQHPAMFSLADNQRAVSIRISYPVQGVVGAGYQGIGSPDFSHNFLNLIFHTFFPGSGQKLDNDFRIHGGLEGGTALQKTASERNGICQIPVMGQGK